MGHPIKHNAPGGIVKAKPKYSNANKSRAFATALPRKNVQPARVLTPELTEPIPQDTMRFADLGKENLLDPILLETITEDLNFDQMMPVRNPFLP